MKYEQIIKKLANGCAQDRATKRAIFRGVIKHENHVLYVCRPSRSRLDRLRQMRGVIDRKTNPIAA